MELKSNNLKVGYFKPCYKDFMEWPLGDLNKNVTLYYSSFARLLESKPYRQLLLAKEGRES